MGAERDAEVIEIRPGVIDEHIAATLARKQRALISPPDSDLHISRGWQGSLHIEAACPCPKEPCGFVAYARVVPECDQHPISRAQTIRTTHPAGKCPALTKPRPEEAR